MTLHPARRRTRCSNATPANHRWSSARASTELLVQMIVEPRPEPDSRITLVEDCCELA